jgi:hypothetical protein
MAAYDNRSPALETAQADVHTGTRAGNLKKLRMYTLPPPVETYRYGRRNNIKKPAAVFAAAGFSVPVK